MVVVGYVRSDILFEFLCAEALKAFRRPVVPWSSCFVLFRREKHSAEPKPLNRYRESGLREASVFLYPMITFSKGRGDRVFSAEKSPYS